NLPFLHDATRGALKHAFELVAARPVNPSKAEDVERQPARSCKRRPCRFSCGAAVAAGNCRIERCVLAHPAAFSVAVNAGGGKIARPFDSGDKFAQDVLMRGEHGIASLAGRGRDQKMCRALERLFRQWLVASKDECLYPRRAEI